MPWEGWLTCAVTVAVVGGLAANVAAAEWVLAVAVAVLTTAGALTGSPRLPNPAQALEGFGNEGLLTVGLLYVVTAGLRYSGAIQLVWRLWLGRPQTLLAAQARLLLPTAGISAFLNNTPVVAMFLPVISEWCRKTGLRPSKLYLPLSYAAILGGTCTLIGTSTNLVVNGMVKADERLGLPAGLGMFDITWVGLPVAMAGLGYLVLASRWLLPDRGAAVSVRDDPRRYTVEMLVEADGPLVGRTVEEAGLRHLPGLFLIEIDRGGQVMTAVGPQVCLAGGDRLVFAGVVESVVDLRKIRGLRAATDQVFKLEAPQPQRCLVEAVVSNTCPLLGQSIREGRFRSVYGAAVVAVARNGEHIRRKIGDIVLRAGDTLLLEAHRSFVEQQRDSRDFFLVSYVEDSQPVRHGQAPVAVGILVAMVAVVAAGWLSMLHAALLAALAMVATRCCGSNEARRSVDLPVLLVIGLSLGLGEAMRMSGAADGVAHRLVELAGERPWPSLLAVYLVTVLFTEVLTNNAAAVLAYPLGVATATHLGVNPMPFVFCVMVGASASFATPIGYQTNLMVYGPGGYRFTDYLRFGIPLGLVVMVITVGLTPVIWPFGG